MLGDRASEWHCTYSLFLADHPDRTAPVLTEVGIKYAWHEFNGSFMQENVFRGHASPEVDAAWEGLGVGCGSACQFHPPLSFSACKS
jgi:hypothetical protein